MDNGRLQGDNGRHHGYCAKVNNKTVNAGGSTHKKVQYIMTNALSKGDKWGFDSGCNLQRSNEVYNLLV